MRKGISLPDLDSLAQQLKSGLYLRYMRAAQKMALLEWRDRTAAPGLAARFVYANRKIYNFADRTGRYDQRKGYLPDYVFSSALRDAMKTREPVSVNGGGTEAVTRMKYGGGHLNFLTTKRGSHGPPTISRMDINVAIQPYTKTQVRDDGSATVTAVSGYTQVRRNRKVTTWNMSPDSYSAEFGRFTLDAPWIKARTLDYFRQIVRGMVWRFGKINNSALNWSAMIYGRSRS